MTQFVIDRKTGFSTKEKEFLILDKSKIPFYTFKNQRSEPFIFNLPTGIYYTDSQLSALPTPFKYKLPTLKERYFFKRFPSKFKIGYGNNPNKCTVDLNNATIFFDSSFKKYPRWVKDYIKFHELGHFMYSGRGDESEADCDVFACWCMIKVGYNPSQVAAARAMSLGNSPKLKNRDDAANNFLKRVTL